MRSLAATVERYGAVRSLDVLRLWLVLTVVAWQSVEVTDSFAGLSATPLWPVSVIATAALFALLGYTLQASRERRSPRDFLIRRLRRAWPPLALATLLTAFALGPSITSNAAASYFRDSESWAYLLNLLAVPRLTLPGVFEFNSLAEIVNPLMWMPLAFALLAGTIALLPPAGRRGAIALAILIAGSALAAIALDAAGVIGEGSLDIGRLVFTGPMLSSLLGGWLGAAAARGGGRIPLDARIAAGAALFLALIALAGDSSWLSSAAYQAGIALPASYLALFLATRGLAGSTLSSRLSPCLAGALLFAGPIQQAVASLDAGSRSALVNLALSLPVIAALAAAAWLFIQRRTLGASVRSDHRAFAPGGGRDYRPPSGVSRIEQAQRAAAVTAIGIGFVAVMLALMALTFYAMQVPSD